MLGREPQVSPSNANPDRLQLFLVSERNEDYCLERAKVRARVALSSIAVLLIVSGGVSTHLLLSDDSQSRAEQTDTSHSESSPRTLPEDDWVAGDRSPLAVAADYTNVISLATTLAYPTYQDGEEIHPAAYTGGGQVDQTLASDSYTAAKVRANQKATQANNPISPATKRNFADCGAFVATVIINTIDPDFPGLLVRKQQAYLEDPGNGWDKVASKSNFDPDTLKPGDLFVAVQDEVADHTWIWLGEHDGKKNLIAQASYGPEGSRLAHLPALKTIPIDPGQPDSLNRYYDVWRYSS